MHSSQELTWGFGAVTYDHQGTSLPHSRVLPFAFRCLRWGYEFRRVLGHHLSSFDVLCRRIFPHLSGHLGHRVPVQKKCGCWPVINLSLNQMKIKLTEKEGKKDPQFNTHLDWWNMPSNEYRDVPEHLFTFKFMARRTTGTLESNINYPLRLSSTP